MMLDEELKRAVKEEMGEIEMKKQKEQKNKIKWKETHRIKKIERERVELLLKRASQARISIN